MMKNKDLSLRYRSQKDCEVVLRSILSHYDCLVAAGVPPELAVQMTIRSFDDFSDWVYFRGNHKKYRGARLSLGVS